MSELDIVADLAKGILTTIAPGGGGDEFLWDRAQRLVRNVEHICRLPELAEVSLQIDRFCLIAATYFSEVGLTLLLEQQGTVATPATANGNGNGLLDFSIDVVNEKLSGVLEKLKTDKISRIITESGSPFTTMTEAMILSDARNLDDMGAVGIFNEFRRYVIGGKAVSDALQIWKSKIDYQYWQARIKDSFHFESIRKLASQRFSAAEHFMDQLKVENTTSDLEKLSVSSVLV